METPVHVAVSAILAAVFYPIYGINSFFIFAGGVLIDIDHYLWYTIKFKKYGLKECYEYCATGTMKDNWKHAIGSLFVFHNIEFLILSIALSFYFPWALMFTIGLLSHYLLDLIWHIHRVKKPTHALSFIIWLMRKIKAEIHKI